MQLGDFVICSILLIGGSHCHTDLKNDCAFHIMGIYIFVMSTLERNMTIIHSVKR